MQKQNRKLMNADDQGCKLCACVDEAVTWGILVVP